MTAPLSSVTTPTMVAVVWPKAAAASSVAVIRIGQPDRNGFMGSLLCIFLREDVLLYDDIPYQKLRPLSRLPGQFGMILALERGFARVRGFPGRDRRRVVAGGVRRRRFLSRAAQASRLSGSLPGLGLPGAAVAVVTGGTRFGDPPHPFRGIQMCPHHGTRLLGVARLDGLVDLQVIAKGLLADVRNTDGAVQGLLQGRCNRLPDHDRERVLGCRGQRGMEGHIRR